jgi:hypothetical protein
MSLINRRADLVCYGERRRHCPFGPANGDILSWRTAFAV